MNELINISKSRIGDVVSARDMYERIGLSMPHWSKWGIKNIEKNEYMVPGVDWEGFTRDVNGNKVTDYAITIDFAKRIIARAKTPVGEKYLTYLIEYEKSGIKTIVPKSRLELAIENVELIKEIEAKDKLLAEAQPKVEFFDQVADSKDAIDIGSAARVLNAGIGRNSLFELLRNKGVLMQNNTPYQKYIDMGWFRVIEQKYNKPDGTNCINIKTLVYQKGLQGILKLIPTKP